MSRTATTKTKPAEGATLFGAAAPEQKPAAKPVTAKAKPVAPKIAPKQQAVALREPVAADNVLALNPRNMLGMIAKLAIDKRVDTGKMREILAMQRDVLAEQARIDFLEDFQKLKRRLPVINRDGRIEILKKGADGQRVAGRDKVQQETPYATYDNIRGVIDPILDEHGFTLWDETQPSADGTRINVIVHLDHKSGHGRVTTFPLPAEVSGSKNNVQGWGSSNSYGKRYGTINLLGIRTKAPEDRDLDGNRPKMTKGGKPQVIDGDVVVEDGVATEAKVSEDQMIALRDAIEACGVGTKKFFAYYEIAKLGDLPSSKYDDAIAACRHYAAKAKT